MTLHASKLRAIRSKLLAWFDQHHRTLPWRSDPTLYHVWVSEIMLQQTQVATVIDYYNRFIHRFPTIGALAQADEAELLRMWEGLGYYRRARSMHLAAKQIVEHHGGEFPTDFADAIQLPGIGRYTAGAILSIALDARLPILEGNTVRVFSRWLGLQGDPKSKAVIDQLWAFAQHVLPNVGSGRFNQAAMELGALVCKPNHPRCEQCPVAKHCRARELGLQDSIPGKVTRMSYQSQREFAFLIADASSKRWLVHRIPEGQRWAGLWDFPRVIDAAAATARSALRLIDSRTGLELRLGKKVKTMKHTVTRFRITLDVYRANLVSSSRLSPVEGEYRFMSSTELETLPLSRTGRQVANAVKQSEQSLSR